MPQGWLLKTLKDVKNKNSFILLQHWWSYCRDKKMQNSVMWLSLMGLQEESGLVEMNGTGNRNVFLGTCLLCCAPTLSSLAFNFSCHQQAVPDPSFQALCCHSVFAVGL